MAENSGKSRYRKDVTVGPRQRVSVYAATKRELSSKVNALLLQVEHGTYVPPKTIELALLAAEWLPYHAQENELAGSSIKSYASILDNHIVPLFGKLRVQHITEETIVNKLAHRASLSSSMRRKIFLTLHMVLKFAKRKKVISEDPMEFLRAPTQKNETDREMYCLNKHEAKAFLDAVNDDRLSNLFILSLLTGIREGELLALRVRDIINDYSIVRIRRTLSDDEDGSPQIKNEPKSSASRRNVPLPSLARDAVLDELSRRLKDGRQSHDLLFSTSGGTFHRRQNVIRRHFRPIVKRAGLDLEMTIHDLRHTYATLALNAGVGVHLVSKMLGHASVKITIDLYSHALPDATAEAAAIVNGIFAPDAQNAPRVRDKCGTE